MVSLGTQEEGHCHGVQATATQVVGNSYADEAGAGQVGPQVTMTVKYELTR